MCSYANMSINIPKKYNVDLILFYYVNWIIFIVQVLLQTADMIGITMATRLVVADVSLSANPYLKKWGTIILYNVNQGV